MDMVIGLGLVAIALFALFFWHRNKLIASHHHNLLIVNQNQHPYIIPVHETVYTIKRPWGGHGRHANPYQR